LLTHKMSLRLLLTSAGASLLWNIFGTVDAAADAGNTEITTPAPGTPQNTSILDAATAQFIITAEDSAGALAGDSELLWVELNKEGTCEVGYGSTACEVLCYPFNYPHTAFKQCESSYLTKGRVSLSSDTALWVVADVTSTGSSTYTVTYDNSVEVADVYVVSAFLLTNGGLYGRYWDNIWFTGTESQSGTASEINFQWGSDAAITTYGTDYISARWEGKIKPPYDENYKFYLFADDGARLWIDKQLIIDSWDQCCNETWGSVIMTASTFHDIIIEYKEIRSDAFIELRWSSDSIAKQIVPSTYLYYQTHINNSPFTSTPVHVEKGLPSYEQTIIDDVTPFATNVAGTNNSVLVTAKDAFGHVLDDDITVFTLTDLDGMTSTQTWLGSGIYRIWFMAETKNTGAGEAFSIQLGGNEIVNSPNTVFIEPAVTSPLNSTITGPGLSLATAGYTAAFNITVFDEFLNERESDGDDINVRFYTTAAGHGTCEYQTPGAGTYDCSYTLTTAGSYDVEFTINGVVLPAAWHSSITVSAGTIHAPTCDISNNASLDRTLAAGYNEYLIIQSKDQFGNTLSTTLDDYVVSITDGNVHAINSTINATVISSTINPGSGQYNLTFVPKVVGTYEVSIKLDNNTHILGSPYVLTVVPGDPEASTSFVDDGTGHITAEAAVETYVVVQVRDAFDNDRDSETVNVFDTHSLDCTSVNTNVVCTYLADGQYDCRYTPTESGACLLHLTIAGDDISGSPFSVAVSPGEISASHCFASGITDGTAGSTQSFVIHARDANDNDLTSGGHTFTSNLIDRHGVYADVAGVITDNTDGTYAVTYLTDDADVYEALAVQLIHSGGLLGNYYEDYAFTNLHTSGGENVVDALISFDWGHGAPLDAAHNFPSADYFSIRWVGHLYPPFSETYTIYTSIYGGSGVRLYLDGDLLIDQFDPLDGEADPFIIVQLTANTLYDLLIDFREKTGQAKISLEWESASIERTQIASDYLYYVKDIGGGGVSLEFQSNVSIVPAATLASACTITGVGLTTAVAGDLMTLNIVAKDSFLNVQTAAGNEEGLFSISLVDSGSPTIGAIVDSGNDGADGLYTATYTITNTSETYTLYITYSGAQVASSPYTVTVTPGTLSDSQSSAVISDGRAGVLQTFTLFVRDTQNNLIDDRTTSISLLLTHSNGITTVAHSGIVDNADGTYDVSYTATKSGEYTPVVTMDGTTLTNINADFNITNAIASASKSFVAGWQSGTPASESTSTALTKVVQLLDIYDNAISVTDGYHLYATLVDGAGAIEEQATITPGPNGTYLVDFTTPASADTYYLNVMLASGDINTPDGLRGDYFNNRWLHDTPYTTQIDPTLTIDWMDGLITQTAKNFVSIRWTGYIKPAYDETYTFTISSDDGSRLYIDGTLVFDHYLDVAGTYTGTHYFATAGLLYPIQIEYRENTGYANITVEWESASLTPAEEIPQSVLFSSASHVKSSPFTLVVT